MLMVMSQMWMWLFNYGFHGDMLMRIWHQAYLLCCTMYSSVHVDFDVWNVYATLVVDGCVILINFCLDANNVKDVDDSHVDKDGRNTKKSVNWSDTDTLLPEESIGKTIASLQIPEVLWNEAIQVLLCKKLYQHSNCIVSNPRIFHDDAIQGLYAKNFDSTKKLNRFKPYTFFVMKQYKYFYAK